MGCREGCAWHRHGRDALGTAILSHRCTEIETAWAVSLGTGELETQGKCGHGPKTAGASVPWERGSILAGEPGSAWCRSPPPGIAHRMGALPAASPEQGVSGPWSAGRRGRVERWVGGRWPLLKHRRLRPRPMPGPGAPSQHQTGPTELQLQACGCCSSPALHHLLVLLCGLLDHLSISGLHSFDHDAPLQMGF